MLSVVIIGDVVEAANPAPYVKFSENADGQIDYQITSFQMDGTLYAGSLAWTRVRAGEVGPELVQGEDMGHARALAVAVICRGTDLTPLFKEVQRVLVGTRVMVLLELQLDKRGRPRLQTQELQILKVAPGARLARPTLPPIVHFDNGSEFSPVVGTKPKG